MKTKRIIFIPILFFCVLFKLTAQSDRDLKLLIAANEGKVEDVIKALLDSADVNAKTEDGITPLMYASQIGNIDIVKILLYNGADANIQPLNGNTALFAASMFNKEDIVLLLLRNKANPNLLNKEGISALHYATAYGYYVISHMLLYYGAENNLLTSDSSTVLMSAVSSGNMDVVKLILEKNPRIDAQNLWGNTALMIACKRNYLEIIDTLLQLHPNINIKNDEGNTALDLAILNANYKLAEKLISEGAVVNKKRKIPNEYIQKAYISNNKEIIHVMKRIGIKQPITPIFSTFSYGFGNYFNASDYLIGVNCGLKDVRYKIMTNIDFDIRAKKKYVLIPSTDSLAYQYRERRYYYAWTLQKYFNLTNADQLDLDFLIGIQTAYSHGNFKGSTKKFDQYLISPTIGFSLNMKPIELLLKWQYTDFKRRNNANHLFFLGINWTIPLINDYTNDLSMDWL